MRLIFTHLVMTTLLCACASHVHTFAEHLHYERLYGSRWWSESAAWIVLKYFRFFRLVLKNTCKMRNPLSTRKNSHFDRHSTYLICNLCRHFGSTIGNHFVYFTGVLHQNIRALFAFTITVLFWTWCWACEDKLFGIRTPEVPQKWLKRRWLNLKRLHFFTSEDFITFFDHGISVAQNW